MQAVLRGPERGGRAGQLIASRLEAAGLDVRLLEADRDRSEELAATLEKTTVLHGDGTNLVALRESGANEVDGFVAVDLLRLDGTLLLDVPLLERKRLLESVIVPGPLLRVSNHVRPPADPWVATWKSMGLKGGMLKAANSRYHPNDDTIEWQIVDRLNRRR